MITTWLAAVLRGDYPAWEFGEEISPDQIVDTAQREGIVALLHERLQRPEMAAQVPIAVRQELAIAARNRAAQSLFRERQIREILGRLEHAGLPVLLLKGTALAYWAYATPYQRECSDVDLLFRSRADADRAVDILRELKFELRERVLPGDLVCFEVTCVGIGAQNERLEVDLHWHLSSTPVFAFRFTWDELYSSSIWLRALATNARGIAAVPAFIHACMHRIQNAGNGISDRLKWLYDLSVLGQRFSRSDWDDLTHQAIQRGLAGTCANGILATAKYFGEVAPDSVRGRLDAAASLERINVEQMHRWWYIQLMNLLAFPSIRQRLCWIRQRLIPDASYVRDRYGKDNGFWQNLTLRFRAGIRRLRS
jgi:hypothetical protein